MQKELLKWFDGMLGSAKPEPTVEIRKILLDSWKEYFEFANVKEDEQLKEFKQIMKARMSYATMSILPPNLGKLKFGEVAAEKIKKAEE